MFKRDAIPSLLNRLVERKRDNKAFLLQCFSLFLFLSPPACPSVSNRLTYRTKLFFNFSHRKYFSMTNSNSTRKTYVTCIVDAAYHLSGYIKIFYRIMVKLSTKM